MFNGTEDNELIRIDNELKGIRTHINLAINNVYELQLALRAKYKLDTNFKSTESLLLLNWFNNNLEIGNELDFISFKDLYTKFSLNNSVARQIFAHKLCVYCKNILITPKRNKYGKLRIRGYKFLKYKNIPCNHVSI